MRFRFLRFALVGVANTALTFAVFNLGTAWLQLPAAYANVIGWLAGFANSLVWNRAWTFRDRDVPLRRALPRFALTNLIALGVSEGVLMGMQALTGALGLGGGLPNAITLNGIEALAIGCSLTVNYTMSVRWAFRPSNAADQEASTSTATAPDSSASKIAA